MQDFTKQFDFGALKSFQGVEAGVENTTYFVSFDQAETVLQIFEEQGFDEIPFFIELNRRLSEDHVPVATPLANRSGDRLFTIKGKPAALFQRIQGSTISPISVEACGQMGEALGKMHAATQRYTDLKRETIVGINGGKVMWAVIDLVPEEHRTTLEQQIIRSENLSMPQDPPSRNHPWRPILRQCSISRGQLAVFSLLQCV